MPRLFGTDGIRAIANEPPLDPLTVVRIGQRLAERQASRGQGNTMVIARDTRISGPMIEAALVAGLCSAGGKPLLAGVLPTPAAVRLAAERFRCGAIVVSASHNPWQYNGLKLTGPDGFKWSLAEEEEFESSLLLENRDTQGPSKAHGRDSVGIPEAIADAPDWYVDSVLDALDARAALGGMRLAVDCANGAAVRVAEALFQKAGAKVTPMATTPDGYNINRDCGAVAPQSLQTWVARNGIDGGAAFDGDADRVVVVDEQGRPLDGDALLWILARHWAQTGRLRRPVVVGTVMSNFGLERALSGLGIQLLRAPVGDRFVVQSMRENRCQLGGEPSGHIVLLDHATTGDGLLTALAVLQIATLQQCPISHLCAGLELLPQVQQNVEVTDPRGVVASPEVQRALQAAERSLQGKGRVLVRPSGTEPVVRVLVEGDDIGVLRSWADELSAAIRRAATHRE